MRKQKFVINYQVYPHELMVVCEYPFDEFERILKDYIPDNCHDDIELFKDESGATTMMFDCGITVIYFKPGCTEEQVQRFIVHEAFHATLYLMDHIGATLTKSSEESYAYLIQYIVEQMTKRIK